MHALIQRLQTMAGISVSEGKDAWMIQIPKGDGILFTVTVPHDVLEWFAAATEGTSQLWSDWADYYATEGESTEDLKADMASDLEWFILTLLASPVRKSTVAAGTRKAVPLEWERNGNWQSVQLCAV